MQPSAALIFTGASRWSHRKPKRSSASRKRTPWTPRGCCPDLEKTATILQSHLGSSLGLRLLDKTETFQFFSYLFNLEEWAERDQLAATPEWTGRS